MLLPAFAPKRVDGYATLMVDAARRALDEAVPANGSQARVAIDAWWTEVTMDVIMRTLFGDASRARSQAAARASRTLIDTAFRQMFWPVTLPDWLPLPGKRDKRRALRTLRQLVRRQIDARRAGLAVDPAATGDDLLGRLLALRDDDTGQALDEQEIFDQCLVVFQAGHETTASALTWWSGLVAAHPDVARRLHAEVDDALAGERPQPRHVARLPWLVASLKEAMRLYPPVSALMTRRTLAPIRVGGQTIPAGAMLRVSPWVLHHDPRWFDEPQRFAPERFVDGAPPIPKGAWIPFGIGPRVCLGQHFAMLEMTLLAAMLLQRYALQPIEGEPPGEPWQTITLRPRGGSSLILARRPAASHTRLASSAALPT
ncbi:MAG: cytochrome P450 [Burkholderiaceae bacterium]